MLFPFFVNPLNRGFFRFLISMHTAIKIKTRTPYGNVVFGLCQIFTIGSGESAEMLSDSRYNDVMCMGCTHRDNSLTYNV